VPDRDALARVPEDRLRRRAGWPRRAKDSALRAIWFYNHTKRGDVVQIVNTLGGTLPGTDGLGDWNIPWEQWPPATPTPESAS